MPLLPKSKRLKKELSLFHVYAIATGSTLGAGFFLLPGLAAAEAGPALVVAYMLAAIPSIPAIFSVVELSTAMPRAGGFYYFIDRSLGPLVGTLGGIGTWLAILFKVTFAFIGMGAYLAFFFPNLPLTPTAAVLTALFGLINLLGLRKTGRFQGVLVCGLLVILAVFIMGGLPSVESTHFQNFFHKGLPSLLSTTGLVYVSYIGITNVVGLSEEVKDPERNLPLGIFLALGTVVFIYGLGTVVMLGVLPLEIFQGSLTPAAAAASIFMGKGGGTVIAVAAILAFLSVANAGILSASRYPLAMGRDSLLPHFFQETSANGAPAYAILATVVVMLAVLFFLDPAGIAKLASSFQLLIFALVNLSVIVMRESRIESYDPGYRSPFYPWMQILGTLLPLLLILQMGWTASLFTGAICLLSGIWFSYYGRPRIQRGGAIYHVFARLARRRYEGLDRELRGILREKGLREEDPYHEVVARGFFLDIPEETTFEKVVRQASHLLTKRIPVETGKLEEAFLQGTRVGVTPVAKQAALPHVRISGIPSSELVLVRCRRGIKILSHEVLGNAPSSENPHVHALFFLVSPEENPGQHLRMLAQIAEHIDDENFMVQWMRAGSEQKIKEILLKDDRFFSLRLEKDSSAEPLIGLALRDWPMPEGCLVALIHRETENIVPRGQSLLMEGDRLTIIGGPEGISHLKQKYNEP